MSANLKLCIREQLCAAGVVVLACFDAWVLAPLFESTAEDVLSTALVVGLNVVAFAFRAHARFLFNLSDNRNDANAESAEEAFYSAGILFAIAAGIQFSWSEPQDAVLAALFLVLKYLDAFLAATTFRVLIARMRRCVLRHSSI